MILLGVGVFAELAISAIALRKTVKVLMLEVVGSVALLERSEIPPTAFANGLEP